jgi:hypothetical protein
MSSSAPSEAKEGRWKWTNEWELDDERLQRELALSNAPIPWSRERCARFFTEMEDARQLLSGIRQGAPHESSSAILLATNSSWKTLGEVKSIVEELRGCEDGKGQLRQYWRILALIRNRTKVTWTNWKEIAKGPLTLSMQQELEPKYKRLREILRNSINNELVTLPRPYIVSKVGIDSLGTATGGVDLSFQYTSLDHATRQQGCTSIYRWKDTSKGSFGRVFVPGHEHAASTTRLQEMLDPHRMPRSVYTEFTGTVKEVSSVPL